MLKLLSLHAQTTEGLVPRVCALQQENSNEDLVQPNKYIEKKKEEEESRKAEWGRILANHISGKGLICIKYFKTTKIQHQKDNTI